jgi:hypothetical protein
MIRTLLLGILTAFGAVLAAYFAFALVTMIYISTSILVEIWRELLCD